MSKPIKYEFVRVDPSHANGTSWRGDLRVAPADLVARFGRPDGGDDYKTSGEYTFRRQAPDLSTGRAQGGNRDGFDYEIFTIYDWKATTTYNTGECPSPDELWISGQPFEFNVGGSEPVTVALAEDFTKWVLEMVAQ
jgi:hypothetical protein